jgi:hypothetical protein
LNNIEELQDKYNEEFDFLIAHFNIKSEDFYVEWQDKARISGYITEFILKLKFFICFILCLIMPRLATQNPQLSGCERCLLFHFLDLIPVIF